MTRTEAERLIADELDRAIAKFPAFHSSHEGYAVIREELDELWDAVKANDRGAAAYEAVQVAAMALRYLEDLCDDDAAVYIKARSDVARVV